MKEITVTVQVQGQEDQTFTFTANDGIVASLEVNGQAVVGLDLFYADTDGEGWPDPNPGAPAEPHINVGTWDYDDDDWRVLEFLPVPERTT